MSLRVRSMAGVLCGAVLAVCGSAQAGPVLNAGQWKSEYRVLVNAQDSSILLGQAKDQLALALPAPFRQNQKLELNPAQNRGSGAFCLTPQAAPTISTPAQLFGSLSKMNPRCRLVAGKADDKTLEFSGRCDDATGFSGNVRGAVKVLDASTWTADTMGVGRVPNAVLTALKMPQNITVQVQSLSTSRWVSGTCQ